MIETCTDCFQAMGQQQVFGFDFVVVYFLFGGFFLLHLKKAPHVSVAALSATFVKQPGVLLAVFVFSYFLSQQFSFDTTF